MEAEWYHHTSWVLKEELRAELFQFSVRKKPLWDQGGSMETLSVGKVYLEI